MTYLQGECLYRRADSARRFNVGRVRVHSDPPALAKSLNAALRSRMISDDSLLTICCVFLSNRMGTVKQGLPLVHFSAQLERFV